MAILRRLRPLAPAILLVLAACDQSAPSSFVSITAALSGASAPAVIEVPPGVYSPSTTGETFPLLIPNGVTLTSEGGAGSTVIDAEGTASVFVLEGVAGVEISGFTIRGGDAAQGGGIGIFDSSAIVRNNVIEDNKASVDGAAIYVTGEGEVRIENNLINRSARSAGSDVHGVLFFDASPVLSNNTIVNGDGNGVLTTGNGRPVIRNNILAFNAGRGICHLTDDPGASTLEFNLFHGNAIAAVLIRGEDGALNVPAGEADAVSPDDGIAHNSDADPLFADADSDFTLLEGSPAIHAGNPGSGFDDAGGGRNTIGHSGGPNGN